MNDGKIRKIIRDSETDFKEYWAALEERTIPNFDDYPFTPATLKKHPKRQCFYDYWVKSGKKKSVHYLFNDAWKKEHFDEIIILYRVLSEFSASETVPQLDGCTLEQTMLIEGALCSVYECFMGEVAGSPRTRKGYDVEESHFNILYELAFHEVAHIGTSDSNTIMMNKIIKGAKNGGAALHPDNLPFKEAYRKERDLKINKGKPRHCIISAIDMKFKASLTSLETWAKEADKEDGFIRRGGRPPKKRVC